MNVNSVTDDGKEGVDGNAQDNVDWLALMGYNNKIFCTITHTRTGR